MKKLSLWRIKARRSSFGNAVRVVSSAVGAKDTRMVCLSRGKITPPIFRRVVMSLTDSQMTVQCLATRLRFLISLKEKFSMSSSMTS